jgi:hypothetical protein
MARKNLFCSGGMSTPTSRCTVWAHLMG